MQHLRPRLERFDRSPCRADLPGERIEFSQRATGQKDLDPSAGESMGNCTADHPSRPLNDGVLIRRQHVFSPWSGVASREAVDASAVRHRFRLALVFSLMRDGKSAFKAPR
jgi:hypothetical protein